MKPNQGFSLMELMVVVAIIGILVAIALPSYQRYTLRARFAQVVQATVPYRLGVSECLHLSGHLQACQNNRYGIPSSTTRGMIQSIHVQNGVITAQPKAHYGLAGDETLVMRPEVQSGHLAWIWSGKAVEAGLVTPPTHTG